MNTRVLLMHLSIRKSLAFPRSLVQLSSSQCNPLARLHNYSCIHGNPQLMINKLLPSTNILHQQNRSAGHSKWQNIKDTKTKQDLARATVFSRIAYQIKCSLKGGSPNPVANSKLAAALENAKKNNMPKASVDKIIQKSQKAMQDGKPYMFDYKGVHGMYLLVDVFTDNVKRAKTNINGTVKKFGFMDAKSTGAVRHMFNEFGCVVTTAKLQDKPVSLEQAEEHAIEAGAEEVEIVDDLIHFTCAAEDLFGVRSSLVTCGYDVESAEVEFIPKAPVTLDDSVLVSLATLVDKLEDMEDVVKVYPNV